MLSGRPRCGRCIVFRSAVRGERRAPRRCAAGLLDGELHVPASQAGARSRLFRSGQRVLARRLAASGRHDGIGACAQSRGLCLSNGSQSGHGSPAQRSAMAVRGRVGHGTRVPGRSCARPGRHRRGAFGRGGRRTGNAAAFASASLGTRCTANRGDDPPGRGRPASNLSAQGGHGTSSGPGLLRSCFRSHRAGGCLFVPMRANAPRSEK